MILASGYCGHCGKNIEFVSECAHAWAICDSCIRRVLENDAREEECGDECLDCNVEWE